MKFYETCPTLYTNNRSRFVKYMEKKSVAIFKSNIEIIANGDILYKYKPNSDLFWLSGITQENAMLVLCPDYPAAEYREILALPKPNPLKEKWDGKQLDKEKAKELSGISTVVWMEDAEALLTKLIHHNNTIYLPSNENDRKPNFFPTGESAFIKKIQGKFPLHEYKRASVILKELRALKTKREIDLVKEAIDITHRTFLQVLKMIKPGIGEYAIEAEIYKGFIASKANDVAYQSIIASGKNACVLHYIENAEECKDGDLVLMDFGASYSGYSADLTRTVPVNGKFTKRQKEIYNACLSLHNFAKSILKPGIVLSDYTQKVGVQATKEFLKIGLLSKEDIKNEDKSRPAYTKYLYHGISHHLGIDVHDIGDTTYPVKENMLFTIEPGIYVEDESMGVRIENNVLLTKNGNVDLMKDIPITIEEIESCMAKK